MKKIKRYKNFEFPVDPKKTWVDYQDHIAVVETMQNKIEKLERFYDEIDQITGDFDDIKPEYIKRYLQDYLIKVKEQ